MHSWTEVESCNWRQASTCTLLCRPLHRTPRALHASSGRHAQLLADAMLPPSHLVFTYTSFAGGARIFTSFNKHSLLIVQSKSYYDDTVVDGGSDPIHAIFCSYPVRISDGEFVDEQATKFRKTDKKGCCIDG